MERIREYVHTTPLELSTNLSGDGRKVYLKLECQQRLKSFKVMKNILQSPPSAMPLLGG
ncbi:MAG: hypothetical protein ACM3TR_20085 [Caulobacteraceae bacterium]